MHLARFDIDLFLRDHWHKRPLLIRNPWSAWRNPLAPDELAGLACEEAVDSRPITRQADRPATETGLRPEDRVPHRRYAWTSRGQGADHHATDGAARLKPPP